MLVALLDSVQTWLTLVVDPSSPLDKLDSKSKVPLLPIEVISHILDLALEPPISLANSPPPSASTIWSSISGFASSNSVFRDIALRAWFRTLHIRTASDVRYLIQSFHLSSGRGSDGGRRFLASVKSLKIHVPLDPYISLDTFSNLRTLILTGSGALDRITPSTNNVARDTLLLFSLPPTVTELHFPISSLEDIRSITKLPTTTQVTQIVLVLEGGDYLEREAVRFPIPEFFDTIDELSVFLTTSLSPFSRLASLTLPMMLVPPSIVSFYIHKCNRRVCDILGWCDACFEEFGPTAAAREIQAAQKLAEVWDALEYVEWGYWFVIGARAGCEVSRVDLQRRGDGTCAILRDRDGKESGRAEELRNFEENANDRG